jgi:hypothetical protein
MTRNNIPTMTSAETYIDRFGRLSSVSRFPPPPVILFKDPEWDGGDQPSKLWIPDPKTLKFLYAKEVTWFFENIEDYTAVPYVAEIPHVDYKGYTDYESKKIMYDAFYLYGLQLVEGDIEFMRQESWSIMRLVDNLMKRETNGAESVYTRVFDHMRAVKSTEYMFLPFLYGSGVSAKLGYIPSHPKGQPPVYPGPPPPAYVEIESKPVDYTELTESNGAFDKDEWDEPVREEPPSYEEAVLACARCVSTLAEVPPVENTREDRKAQGVSENDTSSEPEAQGVAVEQEPLPEKVVRFTIQPMKRRSRKRRVLRRIWSFFDWY